MRYYYAIPRHCEYLTELLIISRLVFLLIASLFLPFVCFGDYLIHFLGFIHRLIYLICFIMVWNLKEYLSKDYSMISFLVLVNSLFVLFKFNLKKLLMFLLIFFKHSLLNHVLISIIITFYYLHLFIFIFVLDFR